MRCATCGITFTPRSSWQVDRRPDAATSEVRAYCSLPCKAGVSAEGASCGVCAKKFALTYAYQAMKHQGVVVYACSEACRATLTGGAPIKAAPVPVELPAPLAPPAPAQAYRLAVLNQKGGTGKTTTSISIAAGLAEAGCRVLLVDCDPQGNVGASLGIRAPKTVYHVMIDEVSIEDAVVPIANNFDVLCSDDTLAAAEIKLAQHPGRGGVLKRRLDTPKSDGLPYTHVVIDCGPSLSLINQNALCSVDEVLIPVACDYLSLVGVKQVLKTIKNVNLHLGHPLKVGAVLPTFYDGRAKICRDALEALRKHFGDSCLPPIRQNTKLKEAPSHKKTIFEHDPHSSGAEDYRKVVEWALHRTRSGVQLEPAAPVAPPDLAEAG
jgi:chromosome partitioning protein